VADESADGRLQHRACREIDFGNAGEASAVRPCKQRLIFAPLRPYSRLDVPLRLTENGADPDRPDNLKQRRKMKIAIKPALALSLLLTFVFSTALAQQIAPTGEKVGVDTQGTAIYQVPSNGIRMAYKLIGAGQPLVMIVGLGNTMDIWPQEVVAALAAHYQLIILDNRGMGHSTVNDQPFSYQLFADDVIGVLDALGVKKTHVLGFSMGSTTTQKLLFEYPQRFAKAVIYATSTDGSRVADILKGQVPADPIIRRQIEATTHWKSPLEKAPAIGNDVMFVVGTADQVVGIESSKILAAAVPGAWLVQFKGATHALMGEKPTEFARIVLTFLQQP
jgi:pimeloyl-ACP methyl ester carboxylesterase